MPVTIILALTHAFTGETGRRLKNRALHAVGLILAREAYIYILKE